jgi:hypothetical protein
VTVVGDPGSATGLEPVLSAYAALGEGDIAPVASVVVFEFSRPWWKRHRATDALGAALGLRADQAVWLRDRRIRKIETRDRVVQ